MAIRGLCVKLDNPHLVYFAGGTVTGTLNFTCTAPVHSAGVCVQLAGECKTRVREFYTVTEYNSRTGNYETVTKSRIYKGDEEYINTTLLLFEPPNHTLQPSIYSFPFSLPIPENIPCSFSGTHGKVRYFLRYRSNHARGAPFITFSKDKETVGIVVLSLTDLNTSHDDLLPVQFRRSKTFGVLTQSLPLFIEISLPKKGYVPGEIIPISAKITNDSDTAIKRCEIWIEQEVFFYGSGTGAVEDTEEHFAKIKRRGFPARTHKVWNCVPYYVPALPPTTLPNCQYIRIQHWLNIRFVPERGMNLNFREKIVIGNVPVKPAEKVSPAPSAPSAPPPYDLTELPGSYHTLPPPSPYTPTLPSAPVDEYTYHLNSGNKYKKAETPPNQHIISVKFCQVSKGETSLGGMFSKVLASYGTESFPPKYPVFDLFQDCADREFEFL